MRDTERQVESLELDGDSYGEKGVNSRALTPDAHVRDNMSRFVSTTDWQLTSLP